MRRNQKAGRSVRGQAKNFREEGFSLATVLCALQLLYTDVNVTRVRLWGSEEREQAYDWAIHERLCRAEGRINSIPRPAHISEATRQ